MERKGKVHLFSQPQYLNIRNYHNGNRPSDEKVSEMIKQGDARPDWVADLYDSLQIWRDGVAACLVQGLLLEDRELGDVLFNLDPLDYYLSQEKAARLPTLSEDDLIYTVTRPALSDVARPNEISNSKQQRSEKALFRTGIQLENHLYYNGGIGRIFQSITRRNVTFGKLLKDNYKAIRESDYQSVFFNLSHGAQIQNIPSVGNRTCGYVVYIPRVFVRVDTTRSGRKNLCSYIAFWGQSGAASLLFANILRTDYSNLIKDIVKSNKPRIAVITFEMPTEEITQMPTGLSSIDTGQSELVISVALDSHPLDMKVPF